MSTDAASIKSSGSVRPATPDDVAEIVTMIRELADYERSAHLVEATEELIGDALFGESPALFGHIAEDETGTVGFALWFVNFSTWTGRHGIYLEDLYVRPSARGRGLGRAMLEELARICVLRGYPRLEWWVLDWNEPAIGFYRSIGAVGMDEWTVQRVDGDALAALAAGRFDA